MVNSAATLTAIYVRVSTEEQRDRQTIATQREFAERYCALHEIPIYGWYADDGISGTIALDQRPEGVRLLQDARDGKFAAMLIYRLDRLGRDPRHVLNAVNDLEQLGVQVRSMTEPFDTSTAAGRFMLSVLGGVAGFERDSIVERSMQGTNRLAREGVWLGGIVPYGYHVVGKHQDARLVISEHPIEGCGFSEADVIRLIYRMTVDEDKPCLPIAEHLNALGVPPAYVRDGRDVLRGKRTETTQGIWRPGRIRNMIVNPTYKGIHRYGVRSKRAREVIEREVPAIVSVETWERAQEKLRGHMIFSTKNAVRKYLLRGLVTCGDCGLTFSGTAYHDYPTGKKVYYKCNGAVQFRGIWGAQGKRCPSKAIKAEPLETQIWADIESFLREPDKLLDQLVARTGEQSDHAAEQRDELARLQQALAAKQGEKDTVIALFRRQRIDAAALDRQLDQIQHEETTLKARLDAVQEQMRSTQAAEQSLRSAGTLLVQLRRRLDEELTWELKRQVIEALVESIRVDTDHDDCGKKRATVHVRYRFDGANITRAAIRTDTDSWQPPA